MTQYAPYSQPSPTFVSYSTARSLRVRSIVAICGLVTVMVATLASAGILWYALEVAATAIETNEDLDRAEALLTGLALLAVALTVCSMLFAGIAFISWLHRARKNLDEFGVPTLRWAPGWSIGGWFVPLANLVIPLLVVNEIDRESERRLMEGRGWPAGGPRRTWFALWATLWTAFLILDRVTSVMPFDDPDDPVTIAITVITAAVAIGAAISAIFLIRRVTNFQEQILQGAVTPDVIAGAPYSSQLGAPATWPTTPGAPTAAPFPSAPTTASDAWAGGVGVWDGRPQVRPVRPAQAPQSSTGESR
ncbi:DUF4328 domain-containing protein [Couchioplanes caeruleus]|uniref:DUF4328 domain-containing protein n=2 Tax=Couchioplanes caeruleus TaxID=56438 RepID=A0A1K0FT10_9ACTN|nr:DUF4328 domain-containing protein [Couchioplanes caeruleus]OJF15913.1 hypothetical protein BG844_01370 [Couchioplanes caeruleus subsp. caeruleus]